MDGTVGVVWFDSFVANLSIGALMGCMSGENLKKRTREFALRIIRLVEALPYSRISGIAGDQILRTIGRPVSGRQLAPGRLWNFIDYCYLY